MRATRPFDPELERLDPKPITSPVWRTRHGACPRVRSDSEASGLGFQTLLKFSAGGQRLALFARPRAQSTQHRTTGEIFITLLIRCAHHAPFDSHLSMHRVPVNYGCS